MHQLSLSLLGSIQVMLNGQPVTGFDYDKVRALLVFLVTERDRPHPRDVVAEMLWPSQPNQVGRDSLRQALSKLRQAVADHEADPPFLLTSREILQFNPDSRFILDTRSFTDLIKASNKHHPHASPHDFESYSERGVERCNVCIPHLQQAVELYRGAFAEDLSPRDTGGFEVWCSRLREYYQRQALDALYAVTEYYQWRGAYDVAQRYAWRQIELESWREEAYRQLMRLLALNGQRTAALAQYERCCRQLDEHLAVAPSVETTALYNEIRASSVASKRKPIVFPVLPHEMNTLNASFVGRQEELSKLIQSLADPSCHLLSVVGPGGMGKTRLVIQAVQHPEVKRLFQRIHFVPLAALNSPELLASAIADSVHFTTMNQEGFDAQLVNYLSDKAMLLVLDNLEHLMGTGGGKLLVDILNRAPAVKLLVTSRERLDLRGEWLLALQGLPVSEAGTDSYSGQHVSSAIQLFIQCARMVQADFALDEKTRVSITKICRLVSGMPLGIELAAAWVPLLNCDEIAESIASNLAFLSATTRDLPERHQSLRAVFDHSWKLLPLDQQRVFRALSLFRGGFQADAALEISGAAFPTLLALVNKSMLQRNATGRYEIHELLRQFALEKLHESGEADQVCARHLAYYLRLVENAPLHGWQQALWLQRLEAENDNLRSALKWSLSGRAEGTGLALAAALWFFWHVRHYVYDGLQWLLTLLDAASDAPDLVRTKALFAAGWLAQASRDLPQAAALSQASLALARQIGDERSVAYPLSTLAWLAYFEGKYEQATALGLESLELFRTVGDSWGIVHTLNILGYIAESQADYRRAELLQREGVARSRAVGDNDGLAWSLYLLGRVSGERGHYEQAVTLCSESLEIYRELGNNWGIALCLYTLGDCALSLGNLERATALAEESVALLREMSDYWAIGGPLCCLGMVAFRQGNLIQANALSQESLIYFQQFGDKRGMAYALNTLGRIAYRLQQYDHAVDCFKQGLALRRDAGIRRGMEICLEQLAAVAAAQGDSMRAVRLFSAAHSLRRVLEAASDVEDYTAVTGFLREQLGALAFDSIWDEGASFSVGQALDFALHSLG